MSGSLELRFDQKLSYTYWTGFQLYSFVDSGLVWLSGLRPSDGTALTSAGGGVRLFLGGDLQSASPCHLATASQTTARAIRVFCLLFQTP